MLGVRLRIGPRWQPKQFVFERGGRLLKGSPRPIGFDGLNHRLKNLQAVSTAKPRFARAIRMRHQAEYVPFPIADAGDIFH